MDGRRAAAILLLSVATPSLAAAQGAALAGVRGTVIAAEHGGPLAQVRVEARHEATGRTATGITDGEGRYIVANLPAGGGWTITATALGYSPGRAEDVELVAGTMHRFDFTLTPVAVALPGVEVRVRGDPRFGADRSGAATVVTTEAVRAHPTIDRNVLELVALSPMAARARDGMTIAGQNARFNALHIDGGRYQDLFGASADGTPGGRANARPLPIDAVEQFQVLVAPFDVRQTGFTGGLLNVVTRGGTNRWEAAGFGHHRDGRLIGSLDLEGQSAIADGFSNTLAGFTVGGPLARDRAHVFAAIELERRAVPGSGYNLGSADAFAARLAPDSAAQFARVLREVYGIDAGKVGQLTLNNPRENVFARLDWQLAAGHRLQLRHNFAAARQDLGPNRAPVGAYELGSQGYRYRGSAHATTLQLVSALGGRWSNDLLVNVQRIADRTTPVSTAPGVEIDVVSRFDSLFVLRRVRAGGHFEAQDNDITQRGTELRTALTGGIGRHLLTVGAGAELLDFDSRYVPNPNGLFFFESLGTLEARQPATYERTLVVDGTDPGARFGVAHFSIFAQDEWSPLDGLTLHAGLRIDVPLLRDRPAANPLLRDELGLDTRTLPRTAPLWSPRVAFNWQSARRYRTQLRGGAGIFTGRPAYAWLAAAYAQTGMQTRILTCSGDVVPVLDAGARPDACRDSAPGEHTRSAAVTVFGEDFRFPQDLRFAGGFDQDLPFGFVASADFVLAVARRQVFLRDVNLDAPVETKTHEGGYTDGFGFHDRTSFGTPTVDGFSTRRRSDAFNQVIQLDDNAENRALALGFELAGRAAGTSVRGAYTWTRSLDVQSLVHRDPATNLGTTVTHGHPNSPAAVRSDFDRPHRLLLSLARSFASRAGESGVSVLYIGESGTPYTYVYSFDINGDAFPGTGTRDTYDDAIYVPFLPSEYPGSLGSAAAFHNMTSRDDCLAAWRGNVIGRNACRAPATHRLDLRLSHARRVAGAEVRLTGDVLNVLHLLGSRYGRIRHVAPLMPLLDVQSPRTTNPLEPSPATVPLNAWYAGPITRDDNGRIRALPPYTLDATASRWQAQLGLEIRR
jgi:hypothetical protein